MNSTIMKIQDMKYRRPMAKVVMVAPASRLCDLSNGFAVGRSSDNEDGISTEYLGDFDD